MVDAAQYHEISESSHRIMNPFSAEKVRLLGDICQLGPASRVLDLACGKGEMLCMFASERGAGGLGIDKHPPFVAAARARAEQLGVAGAVTFLEGDAANPPDDEQPSGIVSCLGATWIGGGLIGTLELMRRRVTPGGWLLVGEVYWAEAAAERDPREVRRRRRVQGPCRNARPLRSRRYRPRRDGARQPRRLGPLRGQPVAQRRRLAHREPRPS